MKTDWIVIVVAAASATLAALAGAQDPELDTVAVFKFKGGVLLRAEVSKFEEAESRLTYCSNPEGYRHICLIDGCPYFGTDGDLPRTVLRALVLDDGTHQVALDVTGMFNPWVSRPWKMFNVRPLGPYYGWIVRGVFSDGAGAYAAEWVVVQGGSIRLRINNDPKVVTEYLEGIQDAQVILE